MLAVESADGLQHTALALGSDALLWIKVEDGIASRAHGGALVGSGEKSAAPCRGTTLQAAPRIGKDHEGRHVLVLSAQSVGHPASQTRLAHEDGAGVHLVNRLRVIDAVTVTAADYAEVIGQLCEVREEFADLETGLSVFVEGLDGSEEGIPGDVTTGHD